MRYFILAFVLIAACGSGSPAQDSDQGGGQCRPPVFSGLFYPSDPLELEEYVDSLIAAGESEDLPSPVAGIVPHAGYVYSGGTAASFYRLLLDGDYDILVRVGLHCAPLAHKTLGTFPDGSVRMSMGYFNTLEEMELTAAALRRIAAA